MATACKGVVPRYLESAMSNFARQQQQMRQVMQQTFSPFLPMGVEEMGRQNIALMERAMSLWNPFHRQQGDAPFNEHPAAEATPAPTEPAHAASSPSPELESLRHEVESLRAQLAIARAESVIGHAPHPPVAPAVGPVADAPAPPQAAPIRAGPVAGPASEAKPAALAMARKARTGKKAY